MANPPIKDLAYRGLASALGGPVDLTTMFLRPFGYAAPDKQVVGGSEWIGQKMQDVGLIGSARSPLQEFLASMAVPTPSGLAKGVALGAAPLLGAGKLAGKIDDALKASEKLTEVAYRGSHKAPTPEFAAPLFDLTKGGEFYPESVYSIKAAQLYPTGFAKADKEAYQIARAIRGNPEAEVSIYRAVPNDENIKSINPGDWTTLSKDYAKTHGESVLRGNYKIISKKVKAKELYTDAESIHELGYWPSK